MTETAPATTYKNSLEIIGWLGVLLVLGGYLLVSLGLLDGNNPLYHLLMLAGSTAVAVISWRKRAYQPLLLNVLFAVIAIIALVRICLFL